ncbi:MAG: type II toxin-antitoxin system HicB family antitoxin [Spirochaetaceae bacterium]|nr:type II toxin-antitoxin system HicB family antitoxin [Spirochaetaceae bacterium]
MSRCFDVVVERDPDGLYVASVPALRGCHTQATSLDDLMERIRESIELCLEVEPARSLRDTEDHKIRRPGTVHRPSLSRQGTPEEPHLEFVGVQRVTVPE